MVSSWVKSSGSAVVAARGGSGTNVVPANCIVEVPAPREKGDPPVEVQAAGQVASAVLMRKAGAGTVLPSWLVAGFGRATHYRVAGAASRDVANERSTALRLLMRFSLARSCACVQSVVPS